MYCVDSLDPDPQTLGVPRGEYRNDSSSGHRSESKISPAMTILQPGCNVEICSPKRVVFQVQKMVRIIVGRSKQANMM